MGYYADHDRTVKVAVAKNMDAAYMLYHAAGHILDDERNWGSDFFPALGEAYAWLIHQQQALYNIGKELGESTPQYKTYSYFIAESAGVGQCAPIQQWLIFT